MTVTIDCTETATTAYTPATRLATREVLDLLNDAVAAVAHLDPNELDSGLPAGRGLLELAGLGRQAIGELGGEPGCTVTDAPGVVVVRELVATTQLLASAVALTTRV